MKKIALIAVATVMLAACPALEQKPLGPGPRVTAVMIDGEYIWLDQEPIIVRDKNITVVWRIATPGYDFPTDGVVFDKPSQFTCAPRGQVFQCVVRNSDKPEDKGRFKYTIKVRSTGAAKTPEPLDPSVMVR